MEVESFCRFCAEFKPVDKLYNLQSDVSLCKEIKLKVKFIQANFVNLFLEGKYPAAVCFVCKEALDQAYTFFKKVKKAQEVVSDLLTNPELFRLANEQSTFVEESGIKSELSEDDILPQVENPEIPNQVILEEDISVEEIPKDAISEEVISKKNIFEEGVPEFDESCNNKFVDEANDDDDTTSETSLHQEEEPESTDNNLNPKSWKHMRWLCAFCNDEFKNIQSLRSHAKSTHYRCRAFKCPECTTYSGSKCFNGFIRHVCKHFHHLRRSSISRRAKAIVNMAIVRNPHAPEYQGENIKSSTNSQQLLEALNNKKLTEIVKKCDTVQQENLTILIHKPATPNPECFSKDIPCKEVMPLQDDLESYEQLSSEALNSSKHCISHDFSTHLDYDSDDSVKYKDYVPSDTDSDISTNDFLEVRQKQQRSEKSQKHKKIGASTASQSPSFHYTNFNVENRTRRYSIDFSQIYKNVNAPILIRKRRNTIHGYNEQVLSPNAVSIAHNIESEISNSPTRKRKKYNTSVQERQLDTKAKKRLEHCVKEGCDKKCFKKCTSQLSLEDRNAINEKYWDLTLQEQHLFVNAHTEVAVPKRKISGEPKRKPRRSFFLKKLDGTKLEVCKIFFLTTLGYKKTNDRILHDIRKDSTVDKRGKHQKTPAFDRDMLTSHVESFNPLETHYRRQHAPLLRYLPSDINVVQMHKDYNEKFPDSKVSYELYRQHVKKMNISFTRLGNEECEACEAYNLHKKQMPHDDQTVECTICEQWTKHHEKYKKASL